MATVNQDLIVKGTSNGMGFDQVGLACKNSVSVVHAGDLVYWDSAAGCVKPVDSDAHAATFVGIAQQPSAVSSNLDNSNAPAVKSLLIGSKVICSLKTTASETYVTGTVVYIGADAQTVTTVAGSNAIGTVVLPDDVTSVTGAAGQSVQVLVKAKIIL